MGIELSNCQQLPSPLPPIVLYPPSLIPTTLLSPQQNPNHNIIIVEERGQRTYPGSNAIRHRALSHRFRLPPEPLQHCLLPQEKNPTMLAFVLYPPLFLTSTPVPPPFPPPRHAFMPRVTTPIALSMWGAMVLFLEVPLINKTKLSQLSAHIPIEVLNMLYYIRIPLTKPWVIKTQSPKTAKVNFY